MRIAIFDVGTRNFAMIIEKVRNSALKNLVRLYSKLPEKEKIKEGRQHSETLKGYLNQYYKECSTEHLELYDPNQGNTDGLVIQTRKNLFKFLEEHKEILKTCDHIAIEEQYYNPKAGVVNKPALMLAECCFTWLLLNIPSCKPVYTPSKYKTALLACPKESLMVNKEGLRMLTSWGKPQRKKWSVEKAKEIYELRGDKKMLEYMEKMKKGDDVADCLLMSIAFVLKHFVI